MKKSTTKPRLARPETLAQWLTYIEAQHPKSIAMGLDRVSKVAKKLKLKPNFPIITIAGTNGKGSTAAMLAHMYHQSGYRVGAYTSPHLVAYNERIKINERMIADEDLCEAFETVELARGNVELTYFEIGTLAAMWHFMHTDLDVAILEVGMGGRLDAVNVFESSCAVVTSIDLDHEEYLGDTREKIALEKAGIFRANKPAICGELNPPRSLIAHAAEIKADLQLINRDFKVEKKQDGWLFESNKKKLTLNDLALQGNFQLNNAACAISTVHALADVLPVPSLVIRSALSEIKLIGRFQQVGDNPLVTVDVAHNPQAAQSLADNLQAQPCEGRTIAVFAMLADKDIEGVIGLVENTIDVWHITSVNNKRSAKAEVLKLTLQKIDRDAQVILFDNVAKALDAAYMEATNSDRIVVFGSFYTVADALKALNFSRLSNA